MRARPILQFDALCDDVAWSLEYLRPNRTLIDNEPEGSASLGARSPNLLRRTAPKFPTLLDIQAKHIGAGTTEPG